MNSYTVFIYRCGYMEWSDEPTIIGFKTNTYFQNNPYSGNSANRIACTNSPQNEWSNMLYSLTDPEGIYVNVLAVVRACMS